MLFRSLLADIYRALGKDDKLDSLIASANTLDSSRKDAILKKLAEP